MKKEKEIYDLDEMIRKKRPLHIAIAIIITAMEFIAANLLVYYTTH
jgi:hypothetical protein